MKTITRWGMACSAAALLGLGGCYEGVDVARAGFDEADRALAGSHKQTWFSTPSVGGSDSTVIDGLVDLLDDACVPLCDGDVEIRGSFYYLTLPDVANAFKAASGRGADVELVLDGVAANNPLASDMAAAMGAGHVHRCGDDTNGRGCIGTSSKAGVDAKNHNKFVTISELDTGESEIVWQSSSNASLGQLDKANNAVAIYGDSALYEHYSRYFDDLRRGAAGALTDNNYYDTRDSALRGDTGVLAYFFPRADIRSPDHPGTHVNGEDPILRLLSNLSCVDGDRVLIAMAFWKVDRIAIVDYLEDLADQGCAVEVIVRAAPSKTHRDVLDALRDADLAGLYDVPNLHSKYIVADARFKGTARQLVWTGSPNFTYGALRQNDEAMLRIDDPQVHADYVDDFETLRDELGTSVQSP